MYKKVTKEVWLARWNEISMGEGYDPKFLDEMIAEGIELALDEDNANAPILLHDNWKPQSNQSSK